MKLSADSPELTAYALGQLTADQAAEVENALSVSPELMAEIEAIQATATLLETEFAAEPKLELSLKHRDRILLRLQADPGLTLPNSRPGPSDSIPTKQLSLGDLWIQWRHVLEFGLAGAAALTLAAIVWPEGAQTPRQLAQSAPIASTSNHRQTTALSSEPNRNQDSSMTESKSIPEDLLQISNHPLTSELAGDRPPASTVSSLPPATKPSASSSSPKLVNTPILLAAGGSTSIAAAEKSAQHPATIADNLATASSITPEPKLAQRYGLSVSATPDGGRSTSLSSRGRTPAFAPLARGATRMVQESEKMQATDGLPFDRRKVLADNFSSTLEKRNQPPAEDFGRRYWRDQPTPKIGNEAYSVIVEKSFLDTAHSPLSTFSIDVDTSSYSNVRRFLREGQLPPADAVRIEELINYFPYDYTPPRSVEHPFALHLEQAACPWDPHHRLLRVAIKAREVQRSQRPHANLVFLVDVSGSMSPENKLPLVKRSLRMLVDRLGEADNVGIVTYAGKAEIALPPTSCDQKALIFAAIDRLEAGSGTNGGDGIQGAYRMAREQFQKAAVNRVLLCTDGDFNVGITTHDALKELIAREAKSGVFLSVLGFGMGNLKDSTMELLAHEGNGHYAYIDSFTEARKVLSEQLEGTLVTVAKDVKIQIEFNPLQVARWRQIGYENRSMVARDFQDDSKDAGDIGAGHTVTALYEIIPASPQLAANGQPLRYQPAQPAQQKSQSSEHGDEWFHIKLRYKQPDSTVSTLMESPFSDTGLEIARASADFKWSAAVAEFGMLLRDSSHKGSATFQSVLRLAEQGLGSDTQGYRSEFIDLVRKAEQLRSR